MRMTEEEKNRQAKLCERANGLAHDLCRCMNTMQKNGLAAQLRTSDNGDVWLTALRDVQVLMNINLTDRCKD